MRLVFPVLLLLLGIFLVYFGITNPGERVTVSLLGRPYPEVPLFIVVLISVALGVTFTAIVALIEGATIRMVNRRLRKEIQKLETEATLVRTEPHGASATPPPDAAKTVERPARPALPVRDAAREPLASAPVYDAESNEPQG